VELEVFDRADQRFQRLGASRQQSRIGDRQRRRKRIANLASRVLAAERAEAEAQLTDRRLKAGQRRGADDFAKRWRLRYGKWLVSRKCLKNGYFEVNF
jgi:hypothetical protein